MARVQRLPAADVVAAEVQLLEIGQRAPMEGSGEGLGATWAEPVTIDAEETHQGGIPRSSERKKSRRPKAAATSRWYSTFIRTQKKPPPQGGGDIKVVFHVHSNAKKRPLVTAGGIRVVNILITQKKPPRDRAFRRGPRGGRFHTS